MDRQKIKEKFGYMLRDARWCFCIAILLGLFLLIGLQFYFHGWAYGYFFVPSEIDTGMDFFNSILYLKGRSPYAIYKTLYPPLANLFFYFLFLFVPEWEYSLWPDNFTDSVFIRATELDLRAYQPTMLLFIAFILVTAVCFIFLVGRINKESRWSNAVAAAMIATSGMIYSYERGNIVIIAMLCILFFVAYKDSENKILSECALHALAIAAGLKVYPAILGLLLIYDKQYKKAARTVIYGILWFVLPVFAFKEGLDGLRQFLDVLLAHTATTSLSVTGNTCAEVFNLILVWASDIFHFTINVPLAIKLGKALNYVVILLVLAAGVYQDKYWKKVLACSLAVLLIQSQGIYTFVLLLPPLVLMLRDDHRLNRTNLPGFLGLLILLAAVPLPRSMDGGATLGTLRNQIGMVILVFYVLQQGIKGRRNLCP